VRPLWLSAAALVLTTVASRDAAAFCRTTTDPLPAGYDPTVQGCWNQGKAIAWLWDQRVGFEVDAAASRQVDLADATLAADQAFARWSTAQCPGGGSPNVAAFDDGPISSAQVSADCSSTPCDPTVPGNYHVIVFRDDGWEYDDPTNTLALTTVTYGVDSAVLFNAEIEINTHDHTISTTEPPPQGAFDLQAILTHEAGHFLGLAHATNEASMMYAYYSQGSRELTDDDVEGICTAYPPQETAGSLSCSLLSSHALRSSRTGGASAMTAACLMALAWARRRRR
jgi:Matrixin